MERTEITIRRPDDLHIHFRNGAMLETVVPMTARHFGRALVMPNTHPKPILTGGDANVYQQEIMRTIAAMNPAPEFKPLMTIQITPFTTPDIVREAAAMGVTAGKVYPKDVTTNSANGVVDYKALYPVFEAMQEVDMVLSLHGEDPNLKVIGMEKEKSFLDKILLKIVDEFPGLRIVLEHITTYSAVSFIHSVRPTVAATICVHYLYVTHDDLIGYTPASNFMMHPHWHCKPTPKNPQDQDALFRAATNGNPQFFYGGDSAPHPKGKKEFCECCAGVFNAPVALALLAQIFEQEGRLDRLEAFVSVHGASFYRLDPLFSDSTITLRKESWTVPEEYEIKGSSEIDKPRLSGLPSTVLFHPVADYIVPFMAGQTMKWKVVD